MLQSLEVREATYDQWRNQYGGMQSEEATRHSVLGGREPMAEPVGGNLVAEEPDARC